MSYDSYESPLARRYAGQEMQAIFSADRKFTTWRKLWIALAESEKELGLPITDEEIAEMKAHLSPIDYEKARAYEKRFRHDVMAHVHAYGDACPKAAGIIHLGATSCFVGDNTDIILMREAASRIRTLLLNVIEALAEFAGRFRDLPTLAYTHFQAAQPTTVGKRACLWLNDFVFDLEQLDFQCSQLRLLGCKGTTGTAASFLSLFDGDGDKAEALEARIAEKMGFAACQPVSGQTYTRKVDFAMLQVLSGIAQSASKFAGDIRLLSHLKEVEEPFESEQIGSSAMAYKRNPMRCERIASLARYVICTLDNTAVTAASQWLERTLDDSANRRLTIPEAFLAADGILTLVLNVARGLVVHPAVIARHLAEEMPFMASENILMYCVKTKGADRQELHEAIRVHSMAAAEQVKDCGKKNDLLERILSDPRFGLSKDELDVLTDPAAFTGMAGRQCGRYLDEVIATLLAKNQGFSRCGDAVTV